MISTFVKNVNLNLAFGNARGNILQPDFNKIRNQSKLVLEETRELLEAAFYDYDVKLDLTITPKSSDNPVHQDPDAIIKALRAIMDAMGDITTVNDGVAHITGFNGDECLQRVYASNMSKFIESEDEVGPALDYYYSRGFPEGMLHIEGEFPRACIKVTEDVMWNDKEYPAGKFLKNMAKFKEPDFDDMLTDQPKRQIKDIYLTAMAQPGQVAIDFLNGAAFMHPDALEGIMSKSQQFAIEELNDPQTGMLEAYTPAFHITDAIGGDEMFSVLYGAWKSNVRVWPAVPLTTTITHLTRID